MASSSSDSFSDYYYGKTGLMDEFMSEFGPTRGLIDFSEDPDVSSDQTCLPSISTTDTEAAGTSSDAAAGLYGTLDDSLYYLSVIPSPSTSNTEAATRLSDHADKTNTPPDTKIESVYAVTTSDGTYIELPSNIEDDINEYMSLVPDDTDESSTKQMEFEASGRSLAGHPSASTDMKPPELPPRISPKPDTKSTSAIQTAIQRSSKKKKRKRRKFVTKTPYDGWIMFKQRDEMELLHRQKKTKQFKLPFSLPNPFKSSIFTGVSKAAFCKGESEICAEHLSEKCLKKSYCKSLHFKHSSLWVRCLSSSSNKSEHVWLALLSTENQDLGRAYRDPAVDSSPVVIDGRSVCVDFEKMMMITAYDKIPLRRLSTPPASSLHYGEAHTVWIWYYQHTDDTWKPMKKDHKAVMISLRIEAVRLEGSHMYHYEDENKSYVVNMKSMTRKEQSSRSETKVKRRPLNRNRCPAMFSENEVYLYNEQHQQRLSSTCMQYLEGSCPEDNKCSSVHSCHPYQWFWVDECKELHRLTEEQNTQLETSYCDPANTTAALQLERSSNAWTVNFESMTVTAEPGRLIRASAPAADPETCDCSEFHAVWIWYCKENNEQWKPYPENGEKVSCQQLEQCMQNKTRIFEFECSGHNYKIDLEAMTQINMDTNKTKEIRRRPKFIPSRRRMPPAIEVVGMDESAWFWSWQDNDENWIPYPEQETYGFPLTSSAIERSFQSGRSELSFQMDVYQYKLDLVNNVQINLDTGKRRPILRQKKEPQRVESAVTYPEHWKKDTSFNSFCKVKIDDVLMDAMDGYHVMEAHKVREIFSSTLPDKEITLMETLQHKRLYHDYTRKREKLQLKWGTDVIEERLLFHGTHRVDDVIRQGFDFRLAGSTTGTLWGKGAYFARDAAYSNRYTPDSTLIVAKVLIGKTTLGQKDIPRPPEHSEGRMYDSCVNNEADPTIYVIFDLDQAYPAYLIKYREKKRK